VLRALSFRVVEKAANTVRGERDSRIDPGVILISHKLERKGRKCTQAESRSCIPMVFDDLQVISLIKDTHGGEVSSCWDESKT
jgi:hypothetical protein